MKRIMLIGAIIGFVTGLGLGWMRQVPLQDAFWHGCLGAYLGGLLLRWYGRVWYRGLREAHRERCAAAAAAEALDKKAESSPLPSRP